MPVDSDVMDPTRNYFRLDIQVNVHHIAQIDPKLLPANLTDDLDQLPRKPDTVDIEETDRRNIQNVIFLLKLQMTMLFLLVPV